MVNKRTKFEKENVVLASISGGMILIKRAQNDLGTHLHNILNHDFLMCMVGAHYII